MKFSLLLGIFYKYIKMFYFLGFRDVTMANQLKKKLSSVEGYLQQLQNSERTMEKHKQTRKDHKKLTVF